MVPKLTRIIASHGCIHIFQLLCHFIFVVKPRCQKGRLIALHSAGGDERVWVLAQLLGARQYQGSVAKPQSPYNSALDALHDVDETNHATSPSAFTLTHTSPQFFLSSCSFVIVSHKKVNIVLEKSSYWKLGPVSCVQ
jgi:hypothetical protein